MDVALAAELVAVCLLVSFRTGLKIAIWQSLLLLVAVKGEQTGLFPVPPAMRGVDRNGQLFTDMSLLWLVVVTTAVAAAVNERELRRRRYDAQALAKLATQLHGDERPDHVASRLVRFVADELDATRALVCRRGPQGLAVVAGHGLGTAPAPPSSGSRSAGGRDLGEQSALLSMVATRHRATLALRLDPALDPWLSAVMPDARRIVAVALGQPATNWLVLEDGARRGRRAERRIISTVSQAAATAALALSRAELLERAEQAAATDPLTGAANRRTFDRSMLRCQEAWDRRGVPFALVLVDVDHFKQVNDRHGHQAGDETLQAVAQVLREHAGGDDIPARYGGEEFALIMPGGDAGAAARTAERVRLALHDLDRPIRVTASFGVAAVPRDADSTAELIAAADAALLRAKAAGRDRVLMADHIVADLTHGI
jgi:diguanylate cyclase (GGDEF)-like protein